MLAGGTGAVASGVPANGAGSGLVGDDPPPCMPPAEAGEGCLQLFVSGAQPARVVVTPTPEPSDPESPGRHPCVSMGEAREDEFCVYTLPQGPVTLSAEIDPAAAPRRFLRWSIPETSNGKCGSNPVCETTLSEYDSIVATFSPVKLFLDVAGHGTVTATPPGHPLGTCESPPPEDPNPSNRCEIPYSDITEVDIEATPTDPNDPRVTWNTVESFCDPPDEHARSCRTEVTYDPTNVGVAFGDFGPSGNFQVDVLVRVMRGGEGGGSVTGVLTRAPGEQIINCGPDCSQLVGYGRRVAVTAHPDADSSFAEWAGGACATNPRCEFYAGAVTAIRAVFAKKQPPPPPQDPPPPPTRTEPKPPENRRFVARIRRVSVVKTRAGRVVVGRVSVNEAAGGRAQVRRARRVLTNRSVRLRVGVNTVRLPLSKAVARGRALFTLTLRSASGTRRTLGARFTVPRKR